MKIIRFIVRLFCALLFFIGIICLLGSPTNEIDIISFFLFKGTSILLIYIGYRLYLKTLSDEEYSDMMGEDL